MHATWVFLPLQHLEATQASLLALLLRLGATFCTDRCVWWFACCGNNLNGASFLGNQMRVLSNQPSGKVVLNPPDVARFAEQSQRGVAVVIAGKDILVSSKELIDHNSMMAMAGIEVNNFDPLNPTEAAECTFRGGLLEGTLALDIWHPGNSSGVDDKIDGLKSVLEYMQAHRGLRNVTDIRLTVYDEDYVATHEFTRDGLIDLRVHSPSM